MPKSRPTVLAIDDDRSVLLALRMVLEPHLDLVTARDVGEAFAALADGAVDVVLLDIRMPGVNGLDVLTRLLTLRPRLNVILVTAVADIPTVVEGMRRGACDYITKPWDDARLLTAIQRAVAPPGPRAISLIASDPAAAAPLEVALRLMLGARISVTTIGGLSTMTDESPVVAVLDSSLEPTAERELLRTARARFPSARLLLLTPNDTVGAYMSNVPGVTATRKPCSIGNVLEHIAACVGIPTTVPGKVLAAIDFIAERYRERISALQVSDAVGLSYDRLAHVFGEATGTTVKEYLTRVRITAACRLLAGTEENLEAIADLVGYVDASHLSRVFTQQIGARPGAYRRVANLSASGL